MQQSQVSLVFVAQATDALAVSFLTLVEQLGGKNICTRVLNDGEEAPVGSIALFTGHIPTWPSRRMRVAAHRLLGSVPSWAATTPFVVALRDRPEPLVPGNQRDAARTLIDVYGRWLKGATDTFLPWEASREPLTGYRELMEDWLGMVAEALGEQVLQEILASPGFSKELWGRGGDVVYRLLADTQRVIVDFADLPVLRSNPVTLALTGFASPVVTYGTSDVANVFEVLMLLKAAEGLGLPAMFETYPGAHSLRYWLEGFLNPSLSLFGVTAVAEELGLLPNSKYTALVSPEAVSAAFNRWGLRGEVHDQAVNAAGQSLAQWYVKAMTLVVEEVLYLVGKDIPLTFTTTESLARATGLWARNARAYAAETQELAGHPVVAYNTPEGLQVTTADRSSIPNRTIGELHQQGWWLGGAQIFRLMFELGQYGGLVALVKDSRAGRVNLLARPQLKDPASGLYLLPVGLFRLTSQGQNEDWTIDPWVFLELLRRWGPQKARVMVQRVWDAMEVPLSPHNVGRKTVATVTPDGIDIVVNGP